MQPLEYVIVGDTKQELFNCEILLVFALEFTFCFCTCNASPMISLSLDRLLYYRFCFSGWKWENLLIRVSALERVERFILKFPLGGTIIKLRRTGD